MSQSIRICSVDGCERNHCAKGLCKMHWKRMHNTGTTEARVLRSDLQCTVNGCDDAQSSVGLCRLHYIRKRRTGSFDVTREKNTGKVCRWPDCKKVLDGHAAKGLCQTHYTHWRKFGDFEPKRQQNKGLTCVAIGCEKKLSNHDARQMCGLHYQAWRKANLVRCMVQHCENPADGANGMCQRHYKRTIKYGSPHHIGPAKNCVECGDEFRTRTGKQVACTKCKRIHKVRVRDCQSFKVTAKDLNRHLERTNWSCVYCKKSIRKGFHLDHVVPVSRGGHTSKGNLVATCRFCNLSKSNKYVTEWTRWKLEQSQAR